MSRVAEALLDTNSIPQEFETREYLHGLSIDPYGSGADNAWKAGRTTATLSPFMTSVLDVGRFDPRGASVRRLADEVELNPNKSTDTLPEQRRIIALSGVSPTPTITIYGQINLESGEVLVTPPSLTQTRITQHTPDDIRLLADGSYQRGLELASRLGANVHDNPASKQQRISNAQEAVTAYAKIHSLAVARYAAANLIPQIYRVFPVTEQLEGREFQMSTTSTTPTRHEAFGAEYAKNGSPRTSLEAWVNGLAVSLHLNDGEVPFGKEELDVISGWLHAKRKRAKLDRVKKNEAQQAKAA